MQKGDYLSVELQQVGHHMKGACKELHVKPDVPLQKPQLKFLYALLLHSHLYPSIIKQENFMISHDLKNCGANKVT
jgi:hypothetical protein